MSKSCRIDEIVETASGAVHVFYTEGQPPLPLARSGNSLEYPSKQAFAEAQATTTDGFPASMLVALAAAGVFKSNPQMTDLRPYKGRMATVDLSGAVAPLIVA